MKRSLERIFALTSDLSAPCNPESRFSWVNKPHLDRIQRFFTFPIIFILFPCPFLISSGLVSLFFFSFYFIFVKGRIVGKCAKCSGWFSKFVKCARINWIPKQCKTFQQKRRLSSWWAKSFIGFLYPLGILSVIFPSYVPGFIPWHLWGFGAPTHFREQFFSFP